MTGDTDLLIVGAGPTGLVRGLWLTRPGARVRIIDKTGEAGTTSRALAVQARTLEFYRLDGHILRQRAVAIPVGEAEHPLSDRQPGRAIAESGDHSGQFVSGD
jgi:2-polyprenyl-6-methoxyphenol hydroxylase-like FAD-dependent oxidoreductase